MADDNSPDVMYAHPALSFLPLSLYLSVSACGSGSGSRCSSALTAHGRAPDGLRCVRHPMNTKERLDNSVALSELSGGLAIVTGGASGIGLGQLVAATEMGM